MSAKINVETDNPVLAAALGALIAQAISDAGFVNSLVKAVVDSRFGVTIYPSPEQAAHNQPSIEKLPADLVPLRWALPELGADFVAGLEAINPGLKEQCVVLSFHSKTSDEYEARVQRYLETGDPR